MARRENSHLTIENKLLIHKTVIKPIWTYGIQLCGCVSKSNIAVLQRAQSKILLSISNAPSNHTLHIDLKTPYVTGVIRGSSIDYFNKLQPLQSTSPTTTTTSRKSKSKKKLATRFKELRKTSMDVDSLTSRGVLQ
jgi:hypothetical protein